MTEWCRSLKPVPEVDSEQGLRDQLTLAETPVVLRGMVRRWPLVQVAQRSTDELLGYLRERARPGAIRYLEAGAETGGYLFYRDDFRGFNFERKQTTMSSFLDRIVNYLGRPQAPVLSVQSAYVDDYFDGVAKENPMHLLGEDVRPRIWLGNATRVATHNDDAENIACVAAGQRRFVLFPPEQLKNLYIGPLENTPAGAPVSLASLHDPDFNRFPKLRLALDVALCTELEAGDAIYIPSLWWHHVEGLAPFNILVNYWQGGAIGGGEKPGGHDALLLALLAIRRLPAQQRRAWQAYFDHYVFSDQEAAIAHLPAHCHGILGEAPTASREPIKNWLLQQLSEQ